MLLHHVFGSFIDCASKFFDIQFKWRKTSADILRLRHTKRVQVAPCKSNGEVIGDIFDGEARILSKDEAKTLMDERKFGVNLIVRLFFYILEILGRGTTVYLEVTVA